ncbi:hypothetical protein [Novosphingobium sp. CECT 9465]|uniref:hypothetical protein n=1 Tax=Novosphingobium sp. CECT 9465 TaxID=2829794 RepID=UPI001E47A216|nr:hypothetical protein [Novosphingobium sp. CECT 9465]
MATGSISSAGVPSLTGQTDRTDMPSIGEPRLELCRFWIEDKAKAQFRVAWHMTMLTLRRDHGAAASLLVDAADGSLAAMILWRDALSEALAKDGEGPLVGQGCIETTSSKFAFPRSAFDLGLEKMPIAGDSE